MRAQKFCSGRSYTHVSRKAQSEVRLARLKMRLNRPHCRVQRLLETLTNIFVLIGSSFQSVRVEAETQVFSLKACDTDR